MITCVKLLYHHEYILKLLMREKEKATKARGEWNVRPDVLQSQIENCTLFIFSDRAGRVLKCIQWDDWIDTGELNERIQLTVISQ